MTAIHYIKQATAKELLRALNSTKEYLYFDISIFNVGAIVNIKCTDTYKEDSPRTWNGYNFTLENDDTTKYYIVQALKEKELTPNEKKRYNKYLKYN